MARLRAIPGILIHGRRDISSPVLIAWELQCHWPGSKRIIDEGDGHGGPSMVKRWRDANDQFVTPASS